jgi:hypothetical protein
VPCCSPSDAIHHQPLPRAGVCVYGVRVCDSAGSFWSAAFTASTVPPVPAQSSAIILRLKTSVSPVAVVARHRAVLERSEIGDIESSTKNGSHHPKVPGDGRL